MPGDPDAPLGAHLDVAAGTLTFRVFSERASRIEVWLYREPRGAAEVARIVLAPAPTAPLRTWSSTVPLAPLVATHRFAGAISYGLRAWGPNWPFDPAWAPGSQAGFRTDVDDAGNRFCPNKLLLDPYARELSHDPAPRLSTIDPNEPADDYDTGPDHRAIDTGRLAPKAVLPLQAARASTGTKPRRPLRDDVVYEVHVRGFTKLDPTIPDPLRGTYRGAGMKAAYLRDLGVTAVELLPVHHFASEQNDDGDPRGDNYWGYMTLGYFAPNRRYASDRTPGGPTREFQEMVRAFHEAGIKVFLDVVYNHTGEGLLSRMTEGEDSRGDDRLQRPSRARLLSLRGLDDAAYYTLRSNPDLDGGRRNQRYQDDSACGPDLNVAHPAVQRLVLDSLAYWSAEMGVDGFRFDLAPVLGNALPAEGFRFDAASPGSLLVRIGERLPVRSADAPGGVDLIAEPWASGPYHLGQFPAGWAEWNDVFRKTLRSLENAFRVRSVPPWQLANALSGSAQQLPPGGEGRGPPWSLNYVASHDGHTLRDVFSYGNADDAWDHGGDPARQRQAVRNALALLCTASGVPMLQGGDELFRTLGGRTNTVAVDDESTWLHWEGIDALLRAEAAGDAALLAEARRRDDVRTFEFARALLRFRAAHPALRPARFFTGLVQPGSALRDLAWYGADGSELARGWDDPELGYLGLRIAEGAGSIFVGCCWRPEPMEIRLPAAAAGATWRRFADTAGWMEGTGNLDPEPGTEIAGPYGMHGRSVVVLVER
jgi:glycogen operon protein